MRLVETISELRQARGGLVGTVGLVPTMGYLHEGHLSLVRAARRENDAVIVTIFVNPTQFGPNEDFAAYPRDPTRDLSLLSDASVDLVFAPDSAEIYPDGFGSYIDVGAIANRLEGARRPGHFRGVATVVAKLFNLAKPTRAYFGQKDAQQCVVIKRMASELNFDIDIRVQPIVREPDGLAMSSRNVYLTAADRAAAPVLAASLAAASERFRAGERDAETLRALVRQRVGREPSAALDYVSVADASNLEESGTPSAPGIIDRTVILSLAARFGRVRLIDNVVLASAVTELEPGSGTSRE